MKNQHHRRILVAALLLLAASPAIASIYPIWEPDLWELIATADEIVVAEVVNAEPFPRPEAGKKTGDTGSAYDPEEIEFLASRRTHRAVLSIRESWKGSARGELEIAYTTIYDSASPAPPVFLPGRQAVVFLKMWQGRLEALAGKTATRYPEGQSLEDLHTAIKEALALQAAGSSQEELRDKKRRWLLAAAERPGTRTEALKDLAAEAE